jgi:ubiquinone/menaquinone biosynthesis C-methylase UbiE
MDQSALETHHLSTEREHAIQKCQHITAVPAYGSAAYWTRRYQAQDRSITVDWLCTFRHVQPILRKLLKSGANVLVLGCGASSFGREIDEEMDVAKVTLLDQSDYLMRSASKYYGSLTRLGIAVDDWAAGLPNTPTASYDCLIDKSTLDTIACSGPDTIARIRRSIHTAARVLTPEGVFVSISAAPPEARVCYLDKSFASVDVHIVDEDFGVYLYACREPVLGTRVGNQTAETKETLQGE